MIVVCYLTFLCPVDLIRINTLCTAEDRERFCVFSLDH